MSEKHQVILAKSLGVCGGVSHALKLFDEAAASLRPGEHIYILHELVHNRCVTASMEARGAVFINVPEELPQGACVLIGAHGATLEEVSCLRERASRIIDTTCPIVSRLQEAVAALAPDENLLVHGQPDHQEIRGMLSRAPSTAWTFLPDAASIDALPPLAAPVLLCQTTLNYRENQALFEKLRQRFPGCRRLGETCRASQERQQAVEELVTECDALVVIGSPHSANARRLLELGRQAGLPSWLIDTPEQLPAEISNCRRIGVTAAASTTPDLIQRVVDALQ